MASIANDPGGRRRILFLNKHGDRKAIWLGKVSKRLAEEIKTKVESINAAAIAGMSIDGETAEWLGKIGDALHAKLAGVGLVTFRKPVEDKGHNTLAAFLDAYISGRTDVKPRTLINLDAARRRLVDFFGADKPLKEITAGDADAWAIWLKGMYANGTSGRTIKRAKQFFRAAVRSEIIGRNPFEDAKAPSQVNEDRKFFVTREMAFNVLEACPDAEWRLIFALCRWGGLRCPSEVLALRWVDVDWERSRFTVRSCKTEHHEGKGKRIVPLFPELASHLADAFDRAAAGQEFVVTRSRDDGVNLRTQLERIIERAGMAPWPKLFQNLRASRETELAADYPIHVVCKWMGHEAAIAQKHYLDVTDADFERASGASGDSAPDSARKAKTAQNTAQHGARTEHARNEKTPEKSGVFCEKADVSSSFPLPPRGLEPLSSG